MNQSDYAGTIAAALHLFRQDWTSGLTPNIDAYLAAAPELAADLRRQLLVELIKIDLELRWQSTDRAGSFAPNPTVEDYVTRCEALARLGELPVDLIGHEYRVRRIWGDRPHHVEYFRRFAARWNELRDVLFQIDASILEPTNSAEPYTAAAACRGRVFGDYELLEEIARGGMGVVYKARQIPLNRLVALKMILSGQLASEALVQRFRLEATAAAKLDHPGIVPIFEIGEHEGQYFFSMGLVEGRSLKECLAEGPLPFRRAAELVKQIADAIEYAHQHGIVHRDIKPANVILDVAGHPRVTDFGLAKQIQGDSDLTATGQVVGTASYMPLSRRWVRLIRSVPCRTSIRSARCCIVS